MVFALTPLVFESLMHLSGTLVGRVPLSRGALFIGWLVVVVAVHFIPAVHDKLTRGRVHPASIWIPLLSIVGFVVLNAVMAPSALAFKVGSWLTSRQASHVVVHHSADTQAFASLCKTPSWDSKRVDGCRGARTWQLLRPSNRRNRPR
jgi:hypothetical protein